MVNAGRILIIAKGEWNSLVNYEQLDLVSYDKIAYLARQASVGVNPSTDTSMTYWQPFGSVSEIATTSKPGLVMPDGSTITIDATGLIQATPGVTNIKDVSIVSLANKQVLRYNTSTSKWENVTLTGTDISYSNSSMSATNVKDALDELKTDATTISGQISSKLGTSDIANDLTQTTPGKVLDATQGKILSDDITNKHKITTKTVDTTGWTTDTSSQSGTTLYKKTISLAHVYVDSPSVDISTSSGTGLPTVAQQEAYDLLQYATVNGTTLTLYASDIPTETFYIQIEGVD
ncbi:MAG: hypothetical protein IIZ78_24070 [Clostridiales bacterium]|nr:hypothetical protein [Clostridiales bacterium]